jgi:hypothetical protein
MMYREIIAVCSQIHTKHINTLCGQNVEFKLNVLVQIVTIGLWKLNNFVIYFWYFPLWTWHSTQHQQKPLLLTMYVRSVELLKQFKLAQRNAACPHL